MKIYRSKYDVFGLDDILFIHLEVDPESGALVIFKDSYWDHEYDSWENVVHIDSDEIEPLIQKWNEYKESIRGYERFRIAKRG